MINNLNNNQPAFTSTIRMSAKTAKALNMQPQNIKQAFTKELRELTNNGRNDIVNIAFKEQISRNIKPTCFDSCEEKVLSLDIVEKRGSEYYSAKARKAVNSWNEQYYKPLKLMDLYKSARDKLKPIETVTNKFMQYV